MNTKTTLLALAVSAAFTHAAVAQNDKDSSRNMSGKQQSSATAGPAVVGSTLSVNGTVDAIDKSDRSVTLETNDGRKLTMNVGKEIQNFDKIKKGDKVAVRYTEAIAVALAKGGSDDVRKRVESTSSRQPTQGRPGMTATERTTIVANVFEIDKDAGKLTLRGPQGDPVDIRVDDKKALNDISKGDQVAISFVEAAAVMIQPGGDTSASSGSSSGSSGSSANGGNASSSGAMASKQDGTSGSDMKDSTQRNASGSGSMDSSPGSASSSGASGSTQGGASGSGSSSMDSSQGSASGSGSSSTGSSQGSTSSSGDTGSSQGSTSSSGNTGSSQGGTSSSGASG